MKTAGLSHDLFLKSSAMLWIWFRFRYGWASRLFKRLYSHRCFSGHHAFHENASFYIVVDFDWYCIFSYLVVFAPAFLQNCAHHHTPLCSYTLLPTLMDTKSFFHASIHSHFECSWWNLCFLCSICSTLLILLSSRNMFRWKFWLQAHL